MWRKKNVILPFDEFTFMGTVKDDKKVYELNSYTIGYSYNITGKGTIRYADKSVYTGELSRGQYNGFGRLTYPTETHSYYEGKWINGIQNGKGTYKHSSGWKCEGMWTNAVMNGKCKVDFMDGTFYEGNSLDNRLTGTGVLYRFLEINGKKKKIVLYKGEFCDEQFCGSGTYY